MSECRATGLPMPIGWANSRLQSFVIALKSSGLCPPVVGIRLGMTNGWFPTAAVTGSYLSASLPTLAGRKGEGKPPALFIFGQERERRAVSPIGSLFPTSYNMWHIFTNFRHNKRKTFLHIVIIEFTTANHNSLNSQTHKTYVLLLFNFFDFFLQIWFEITYYIILVRRLGIGSFMFFQTRI